MVEVLDDLHAIRHLAERGGTHAPDAPAAPHSIVVLPFENLSPDPDNAYFADGPADRRRTGRASLGREVQRHDERRLRPAGTHFAADRGRGTRGSLSPGEARRALQRATADPRVYEAWMRSMHEGQTWAQDRVERGFRIAEEAMAPFGGHALALLEGGVADEGRRCAEEGVTQDPFNLWAP